MAYATRMGESILPHRQKYVAECYDENKIVPCQPDSVVTPGFPLGA